MARPFKCRRVAFMPGVTYFKPAGIPLRALQEIRLTVEEAEAIRLKDLEDLEQEEGAEKMNISRPTFQRILASARQKIADALLNGKAIRIDGGNFEISPRLLHCTNSHEWEVPSGAVAEVNPQFCPVCNAPSIELSEPAALNWGGRGRGWRRGRCSG
ncbi:DUF134 domain-containing protein [Chloroflexota bacterium]